MEGQAGNLVSVLIGTGGLAWVERPTLAPALIVGIATVAAFITAFYMFRLMGLTFWGKSRVDKAVEPKIHESPWTMTVPLIVLVAEFEPIQALLIPTPGAKRSVQLP